MKPVLRRSLVLLACLLLAGCERKAAEPPATGYSLPSPPRIAACEQGQPGGRLRLVVNEPPLTFNPIFALDNTSDQIARLLFGTLVRFDFAKQEAQPGLAESWSVTPDGRTWTFKLRRGLRWSDGQALTAADVVFTWNDVIYNPRTRAPLAPVFRVRGRGFQVSAPDEDTVAVSTAEVFAPFLEFFGTVPILPRHALEAAARKGNFMAAYGSDTPPEKIIGAGPFRLKEHHPGQSVVLERNPAYWATDRAGQRLPYLDEVEITVEARDADVVGMLLAGQCDVGERLQTPDFTRIQAAGANGKIRVVELGASTQRDCLWFNQNTNVNRISGQPFVAPHKLAWFRNTAFRQAISCGINRERLVRDVYGGHAVSCETYLGPESGRWHNPDVPRFGYDVERARTLLAQAGLRDHDQDSLAEDSEGHPCEILLQTNSGNPIRGRLARLIADDLRQIGIKLVVELIPFEALERRINDEFVYESVLMGLSGSGGDPASHLNVLLSSESLHQWFPRQPRPSTPWEARLDELMESQMRTLNSAARKAAFDEVQAILAEQLPMIYTVTPQLAAACSAGLANLRPAVLAPSPLTWNSEELSFGTK